MAGYVQIGEVNTWYDEVGAGEPVVVLHPGGADARAMDVNVDALAPRYRVLTPERRGHGRTPDVDGPISYELMARDTIAFIETVVGEPVHLLGCSDGSTVALLVAHMRPDLVRRAVLACGVFHHDGWLPGAIYLDDETASWLADSYGEISPDGRDHYYAVMDKLEPMHEHEPRLTADDLAKVTSPLLVMSGDDDEVRLEHSIAMFRGLANSQLAIVPGTSHGLLVEKPELCNAMIAAFLAG